MHLFVQEIARHAGRDVTPPALRVATGRPNARLRGASPEDVAALVAKLR